MGNKEADRKKRKKESHKKTEHSEQEDKSPVQNNHEPDLTIDIPQLKAKSLVMDAENVNFSISVKAQLANLTNVEIGTTIHIDKVKLDIDSLETEAYFEVKLKKIESIFLKALESLDKHPTVLKHVEKSNGEDK